MKIFKIKFQMRWFLCVIFTLCVVYMGGKSILQFSKSRNFQFFGGLTAKVATSEKVVALTFDDGPSSHTAEILNILKDQNIKATFYVMGSNIQKYPQETKSIIQKGHQLGNHSFSHTRMMFKPLHWIENEIQKTNSLIKGAGYMGEITFRPPNGKKLFLLPWYINSIHMKTIMWDVEPDTFYKKNSTHITRYVLNSVKPGSIILIHPFCNTDCEADRQSLPEIISGLKAKGYRFVTINQLLTYQQN